MSADFMAQLPLVGRTSTLGWQRDDVAQSYMEHIMQRVLQVLPKRGWRVGVLKEFYPRGRTLLGLNVNQGSEVCVRFRVPGAKGQFLPFHEVLCTTLHELAHCQIAPHNTAFWNLYYELVRECEALEVEMVAKGIALYPPHVSDPSTLVIGGRGDPRQQRRPTAQRQEVGNKLGRASSAGGRTGRGGSGSVMNGRVAGSGTRLAVVTPQPRASTVRATYALAPPTPSAFTGEGHRLGGSAAVPLQREEQRWRVAEAATQRMLAGRVHQQLSSWNPMIALTTEKQQSLSVPRAANKENATVERSGATSGDDEYHGIEGSFSGNAGRPSLSQIATRMAAIVPVVDTTEVEPREEHGGGWRCERGGARNSTETTACSVCSDVAEESDVREPRAGGYRESNDRKRYRAPEDRGVNALVQHVSVGQTVESPMTISDDSDED